MPKLNTGIAPGRYGRKGISLIKLAQVFPDEAAARQWIQKVVWPNGRICPHCKGDNTYEGTHKTMSYRCRPCRKTFSIKTGTVLADSNISFKVWVWPTLFTTELR